MEVQEPGLAYLSNESQSSGPCKERTEEWRAGRSIWVLDHLIFYDVDIELGRPLWGLKESALGQLVDLCFNSDTMWWQWQQGQ